MEKILCILVLFVWGCQNYQPQPLDWRSYESHWQKILDHKVVVEYPQEWGIPSTSQYNITDGLELEEARVVALIFNPKLRVLRQKAKVSEIRHQQSGQWQDPRLEIDIAKIFASISEPWILITSLQWTIPISGSLSIQKDLLATEYRLALWEAYLAERSLLSELNTQWLKWSELGEQIRLKRQFIEQLQSLEKIALALQQSANIPKNEFRYFLLEKIFQQTSLQILENQKNSAKLAIMEILGVVPEATIVLHPSLVLPQTKWDQYHWQNHPFVAQAQVRYELTEQNLRLQIQKQYPDLTLGSGYEREEGQSRVGAFLGMDIPIINRNQSSIAEAESLRLVARTEAEATYQQVRHRFQQSLSIAQNTYAVQQLLQQNTATLISEQQQDLQNLLTVGEVDFFNLLSVLKNVYESQTKILENQVQSVQAVYDLYQFLPSLKKENL